MNHALTGITTHSSGVVSVATHITSSYVAVTNVVRWNTPEYVWGGGDRWRGEGGIKSSMQDIGNKPISSRSRGEKMIYRGMKQIQKKRKRIAKLSITAFDKRHNRVRTLKTRSMIEPRTWPANPSHRNEAGEGSN
jgi:hypothetical protein